MGAGAVRKLSPGPMTWVDIVRYSFVVFVVLVVQHAALDFVRLSGAHPDAVLLLPVAAGYVGGAERGARIGFFTGLVTDLLLPTPFGLSALVGCMLGFATGASTRGLVRSTRLLGVTTCTVATVAGLAAYAILGAVIGQPGSLSVNLGPALVIATPAAAILATPVLALVRWSVPPEAPAATAMSPGAVGR